MDRDWLAKEFRSAVDQVVAQEFVEFSHAEDEPYASVTRYPSAETFTTQLGPMPVEGRML